MIGKKSKIVGSILLLIFLSAIFWGIGFYNGARKAFLFDSIGNAASCVHTMKYIDKQEYEKVRSVQSRNLEVSMAGIDCNSNDNASLLKTYRNMRWYFRLLSFDEKAYIEGAKMSYSAFIKDKAAAGVTFK